MDAWPADAQPRHARPRFLSSPAGQRRILIHSACMSASARAIPRERDTPDCVFCPLETDIVRIVLAWAESAGVEQC